MVKSHSTAFNKRKEVVKMTIFIKVKKTAYGLGREKVDLNWIGSTSFYTKDPVKDIRLAASSCFSIEDASLSQSMKRKGQNGICYPEGYGSNMEEQFDKEIYF